MQSFRLVELCVNICFKYFIWWLEMLGEKLNEIANGNLVKKMWKFSENKVVAFFYRFPPEIVFTKFSLDFH